MHLSGALLLRGVGWSGSRADALAPGSPVPHHKAQLPRAHTALPSPQLRNEDETKARSALMKLTFLLGSGISIPAGLPSVRQITDAVMAGDGIIERSALSTGYAPDERRERENGRRIIIFLNWLKAQAACRYAEMPNRRVNYEDLAYLADQIADDIGCEYENPAIQPFVRDVLNNLEGIFRNTRSSKAREELKEIAESAVTYISKTVVSQLPKKPQEEDTRYLEFFAKACRDDSFSEVNLFTLNHDTLLEDFLRNKLYNDGFEVVDGLRGASNGDGSRRWCPKVFDRRNRDQKLLKVFKLHGSIGWIRWEPKSRIHKDKLSTENVDRDRRFVGTYKMTETTAGPFYRSLPPALILVGTFNKLLKYNSDVFNELHYRFHRALEDKSCKTLVVCGYGFGDKGVNTRIVEWRRRSSEHKLLIIDPAESIEIFQKARGTIQNEIEAILGQQESKTNACLAPCSSPVGSVKHLQMGIGKRRDDTTTKIVTWKKVKRHI
jgi:hypothetical protein